MQKVLIVLHLIKYMIAETTISDPNISNDQNKELISHGELFDIQKYPYMVYFEITKFSGFGISTCTGSLILPLFVLTAAHCTYEADKYDIVVTNTFNIMQKKYTFFLIITYCHYNSSVLLLLSL